jgi:hypothetical protein
MRRTTARRVRCPNKSASGNHLGQNDPHPPAVDDKSSWSKFSWAGLKLPNEASKNGLCGCKSRPVGLPRAWKSLTDLLIPSLTLPSEPSAPSRFAYGLLPISSYLCVWHHALHLSQMHQSDAQFSPAPSLVRGAFYEAPFQICLRCPHFLLLCS